MAVEKQTRLRVVKGDRAIIRRRRKRPERPRRVCFVPRESGEIVCIEVGTMQPLRLHLSVEVTIEDEAAVYEVTE